MFFQWLSVFFLSSIHIPHFRPFPESVPLQEDRLSITIFLGMPQLHGAIGEHVHTRGEQERRVPCHAMGMGISDSGCISWGYNGR